MRAIVVLVLSLIVCGVANAADVNLSIAKGIAKATGKSIQQIDFNQINADSKLPGRYTVNASVAGEGSLECTVKIDGSGYPFHTICTGGRIGKYVGY